MREVKRAARFNSDLKRAERRGCDRDILTAVVGILASGGRLPANFDDHQLQGRLRKYRECHLTHNWLLVYQLTPDGKTLLLVKTGPHSLALRKPR